MTKKNVSPDHQPPTGHHAPPYSGRSSGSSWTELRWPRTKTTSASFEQESVLEEIQEQEGKDRPSLFAALLSPPLVTWKKKHQRPKSSRSDKNDDEDDYDLVYSGPVTLGKLHDLVKTKSKAIQQKDPLLALIQLSALLEEELLEDDIMDREARCYLDYLRVSLFQMKHSGLLERSGLQTLREHIRNASVADDGDCVMIVPIEPPLPHPFSGQQVGSFQVLKVLDATSRPKVIRFYVDRDGDGEDNKKNDNKNDNLPSNHDEEDDERVPALPDVLYKAGDDLRQDLLILSSIAIFNMRWHVKWNEANNEQERDESSTEEMSAGADIFKETMLRLAPQTQTYRVLPWGIRDGLIELVPHVMDQREWVSAISAQQYFASAAASVTAGWALGIGDRHRRNILANTEGQVFHIDFGYAFGLQAPLESSSVPVPKSMYNDLNQEELWDVFVDLCLVLFDHLASGVDVCAPAIDTMGRMIGYQTPEKVRESSLEGFVRHQLSTEGRERFHQSIVRAPFNLKNEFKEAIIPLWYLEVARYCNHKEAGANVLGHLQVEAGHYGDMIDRAGRRLVPDMRILGQKIERELQNEEK